MAADGQPITPVPLPASAREVLVFGGTFDPPHAAHTALPFEVRDSVLGPDAWLLYVPAARNPLKPHGPEAPDQERLRMLRMLIAERVADGNAGRVAVWSDEFDRAGAGAPSYTIDTIDRLRVALAGRGVDLRLLIGSDQAAEFHRWREAQRLLKETRPIVVPREPLGTKASLRSALEASGAWSKDEIGLWLSRAADTGMIDASSTSVRDLLHAHPRDRGALEKLLTRTVFHYIESRGLYQ